jgi:ribosomal protein S18 acetylase RimI-like enzyme
MEVKIDNKWHKVAHVGIKGNDGYDVAPERMTDVKLNGKQLFGNSEQVQVQEQTWYTMTRYLLTLDGASVQLETYSIPQGQFNVKAYIYALWVDESERRKGKATKLMNMAERIAKQHGYKEVFLDWSSNEAELSTFKWYERRGYKEIAFGEVKSLMKKEL